MWLKAVLPRWNECSRLVYPACYNQNLCDKDSNTTGLEKAASCWNDGLVKE